MQRHFTPRRPLTPLSDAERNALARLVVNASAVRAAPAAIPRARMGAFLRIATTGQPWRALPQHRSKPDTASRLLLRWTHAGLWSRLLEAPAAPDAPPALRAMASWLCRVAGRAMRLLDMKGPALAQRLGVFTALPMLPWRAPMPDLSKRVFRHRDEVFSRLPHERPPSGLLANIGRFLAIAGGRPVRSKEFAPL